MESASFQKNIGINNAYEKISPTVLVLWCSAWKTYSHVVVDFNLDTIFLSWNASKFSFPRESGHDCVGTLFYQNLRSAKRHLDAW